MKSFKSFYHTQAWVQCRNSYLQSVGGLCERCLSQGRVKAGEIVHHKIYLNDSNINNPEITLNWSNLMLVCRDCHAEIHGDKAKRRYIIHEDGSVELKA